MCWVVVDVYKETNQKILGRRDLMFSEPTGGLSDDDASFILANGHAGSLELPMFR